MRGAIIMTREPLIITALLTRAMWRSLSMTRRVRKFISVMRWLGRRWLKPTGRRRARTMGPFRHCWRMGLVPYRWLTNTLMTWRKVLAFCEWWTILWMSFILVLVLVFVLVGLLLLVIALDISLMLAWQIGPLRVSIHDWTWGCAFATLPFSVAINKVSRE